MTAKDCGHDDEDDRNKLFRNIIAAVGALVVAVLLTILIVYLVLRPTKPQFVLFQATVYQFNLTSPNSLTSTFQVTLSSKNPNARIGIYYDHLDVYASYRGQQITPAVLVPPTYQGHKDINVWSPFISGMSVPVAPYLAESLAQDQFSQRVLVNIKVNGRVRFKVGTFISGKYHLFVNCPAYVVFGNVGNGVPVGPEMKLQWSQSCHVDV